VPQALNDDISLSFGFGLFELFFTFGRDGWFSLFGDWRVGVGLWIIVGWLAPYNRLPNKVYAGV